MARGAYKPENCANQGAGWRPILIEIEGPAGVGKSTLAGGLTNALGIEFKKVGLATEFSGSPVGSLLRKVSPRLEYRLDWQEGFGGTMFYLADKVVSISQTVAKGASIVVSDRGLTTQYVTALRTTNSVDSAQIVSLVQEVERSWCFDRFRRCVTFCLIARRETIAERAAVGDPHLMTRLEDELEGYGRLISSGLLKNPQRVCYRIDASGGPDEVLDITLKLARTELIPCR